jgi:hypothetical protein
LGGFALGEGERAFSPFSTMRKFKLTIQVDGVDWEVVFLYAQSHAAAREMLFSSMVRKLWYEKQNWNILVEEV